jgi:adenylyltransferase/sulfurtransferase
MDPDAVAGENLHRQILYGEGDLGRPKAAAAAGRLTRDFPGLEARALEARLDGDAPEFLRPHDLVLEGTDDAGAKFLANRAAVKARIPCVIGGAIAYGGQAFAVPAGGRPCLACLWGDGLDADLATCATAGVLGPAAGVVGALMARMGAGLLEGTEPGGLAVFDGRKLRIRRVPVPADPDCPVCGRA